jgi:hypothetical protein
MELRDIVTGKTCVPASLNASLGDAAVLLFLFHGWGCAYLSLQVKAIKATSCLAYVQFSQAFQNLLSTKWV